MPMGSARFEFVRRAYGRMTTALSRRCGAAVRTGAFGPDGHPGPATTSCTRDVESTCHLSGAACADRFER